MKRLVYLFLLFGCIPYPINQKIYTDDKKVGEITVFLNRYNKITKVYLDKVQFGEVDSILIFDDAQSTFKKMKIEKFWTDPKTYVYEYERKVKAGKKLDSLKFKFYEDSNSNVFSIPLYD